MPKKAPAREVAPLPSTLERSPKRAQATYEATLESAERTYSGDEERAHRAAWGAVKHAFEKVGDHWEPKAERGPSDPRSAQGGPDPAGASFGGVDLNGRSKAELIAQARRLGARITTRMTKHQIAQAIETVNDRATRQARTS